MVKRVAMYGLVALLLTGSVMSSHAQTGKNNAGQVRSERSQLVYDIVLKWGPHVRKVYGMAPDEWAKSMRVHFSKAPLASLRSAVAAKEFSDMNIRLLGPGSAPVADTKQTAASTEITPKVFGDADRDLIFVPVTPCRLFDTRLAGGAIAANTVRGFDVTAVSDYSFQGGSNTNCGGVGAAGSFAAAAINFTVVTPGGAGYITAFPFGGTQPLAATVNYTAGDIRGNYAVVKLDQGASANELNVYTFAQTHLVGDIVGYYINPGPLAFECTETATTNTSVAAGGQANSVAPTCPAGYTQTATNCQSSTWQMPFVYFSGGTCSAQNNSGSAATLRSSRTCCRVQRT
ncbi:hypothetical protein [Pseudoxanthomonas mexicana]